MIWFLKGISIFLSLFLLGSCSLQSEGAAENEIDETAFLYPEFIDEILLFQHDNHDKIDSIGFKIAEINDSLFYHPYTNNIENNAFIFSATKIEFFKPFLRLDVFKESFVAKDGDYQVWRMLSEVNKIEASVEPHPTIGWVLVFRKI
ncbi:MAG: hypothetical protein WC994_02830 [Brumimicrobium sp.]